MQSFPYPTLVELACLPDLFLACAKDAASPVVVRSLLANQGDVKEQDLSSIVWGGPSSFNLPVDPGKRARDSIAKALSNVISLFVCSVAVQ